MAIIDQSYRKKATMIEIEEFFAMLKECMEAYAGRLRNGRIILPQYLKGGSLEPAFRPVARCLARTSNLRLKKVSNPFLREYECGNRQIVDFGFVKKDNAPVSFLELESLGGSQLYQFFEYKGMKDNSNKLWYYYGTLGNYYTSGKRIPRYFVWLLCLPDCRVDLSPYQQWDIQYKFIHPSLKGLVCQSPYRFYDHLIKSAARLFVTKPHEFKLRGTNKWTKIKLTEFEDACELVFITWTGDRLIMSRGKDLFEVNKEKSVALNWRK